MNFGIKKTLVDANNSKLRGSLFLKAGDARNNNNKLFQLPKINAKEVSFTHQKSVSSRKKCRSLIVMRKRAIHITQGDRTKFKDRKRFETQNQEPFIERKRQSHALVFVHLRKTRRRKKKHPCSLNRGNMVSKHSWLSAHRI